MEPELQFTHLPPETLPLAEKTIAVEFGLRRVGILRIITPENFDQVLGRHLSYLRTRYFGS